MFIRSLQYFLSCSGFENELKKLILASVFVTHSAFSASLQIKIKKADLDQGLEYTLSKRWSDLLPITLSLPHWPPSPKTKRELVSEHFLFNPKQGLFYCKQLVLVSKTKNLKISWALVFLTSLFSQNHCPTSFEMLFYCVLCTEVHRRNI